MTPVYKTKMEFDGKQEIYLILPEDKSRSSQEGNWLGRLIKEV